MTSPTLSKAILRLRPSRGWTSEYITHQLVADLHGDRDDRGYLYRVTRERPGGVEVLVLSAAPPLPLDLVPVRDWGTCVDLEHKAFAPRLVVGQRLDFEIRLNGTRVVTSPDDGKKRRTDVWEAAWRADPATDRTPHDLYAEYLRRKLDSSAIIESARVTERGEVRVRGGGRRDAIRFVVANVIGTLRVSDPDGLRAIAFSGIGRERAFGCGLLCFSAPGAVLPRRYPEVAPELS